MPSPDYRKVERLLGKVFRRKKLIRQALTHSSFSRNNAVRTMRSNETMEFLGDAVLELIVREHLYKKFPALTEGELNEIKVKYTNTEMLHHIGSEMGIGELLLMDRGEDLTGGRTRPSNIAGAFEALIGALYLDQGMESTRKFIKKHVLRKDVSGLRDHKSLLNRWAMKEQRAIGYRVARAYGPAHHRVFHVDLYIDRRKVSRGTGDSKKKAQQSAARRYLEEQGIVEEL